jgi:hypothetical protein
MTAIKNRLRKLEKAGDNSTVCACYPQIRVEVYQADLSEDSDTSEPVLTGEPVPNICPVCRKPIEKRKIILQLCDHTTKDRFPDEWQSIREKP